MDYQGLLEALDREHQNWLATGETRTAESAAYRAWWENYQAPAPSGGSSAPAAPAPPPPVPPSPWVTTSTYTAPTGIKQATPDIIVFDETSISPEFLTEAFFEEFGGTELITISRSDLINGDAVSYSPIRNLSSLRRRYNPNNIIAIGVYQQNLGKYSIRLIDRGPNDPYFDANGNLIVDIDTVNAEEYIEVQVASDGTMNRVQL